MEALDYRPDTEPQISQDHIRYTLFIWMLPVIFITPLALFSLQEWWHVMVYREGGLALELSELAYADWQSDVNLVIAWTALVQAVCWLAYAGCVTLGFYRRHKPSVLVGYLILLSSLVLQWQLPPVLVRLIHP